MIDHSEKGRAFVPSLATPTFDVHEIPFSRRGSWLDLSPVVIQVPDFGDRFFADLDAGRSTDPVLKAGIVARIWSRIS